MRITTRFLIISDTHSQPLFPAQDAKHAYRHPLPKADVLLHCGDVTEYGTLDEYEKALAMLASADAELKLVIAGNHDTSLDATYWQRKALELRRDPKDHERAIAMWTGEEARAAGVTYLEEGVHEFVLQSGAKLRVYASPYQPEFFDWAFPYKRNEDRYNHRSVVADDIRSIVEHEVPSFPDIDVMMTHGPPEYHLDRSEHPLGRSGGSRHVGCPHLFRALSRAKPLLHCFGHIHEGYGAELLWWRKHETSGTQADILRATPLDADAGQIGTGMSKYLDLSKTGDHVISHGEMTLLVNAAIMTRLYKPEHAPWIVDLDLPTGQGEAQHVGTRS